MPTFRQIVSALKKQERQLAGQLEGIRSAISSLEFGGFAAPVAAIIETPHAAGRTPKRKRRKMSAAERKAVSMRMRKYWAARRKTAK